jgi:hypothetical protein
MPFLVPESISTQSNEEPSSVEVVFDQSSGTVEEPIAFSLQTYDFPSYGFQVASDGGITSL